MFNNLVGRANTNSTAVEPMFVALDEAFSLMADQVPCSPTYLANADAIRARIAELSQLLLQRKTILDNAVSQDLGDRQRGYFILHGSANEAGRRWTAESTAFVDAIATACAATDGDIPALMALAERHLIGVESAGEEAARLGREADAHYEKFLR